MKLDELLVEYRESLEAMELPPLPALAPRGAYAWWWMAAAAAVVLVLAVGRFGAKESSPVVAGVRRASGAVRVAVSEGAAPEGAASHVASSDAAAAQSFGRMAASRPAALRRAGRPAEAGRRDLRPVPLTLMEWRPEFSQAAESRLVESSLAESRLVASEAQPGDAQPGHAQPGHAHRERPQTALTQSTPQPAASGKAEREFVALAEAAMLPTPAVMQVVQVSVRAQRLAELGIACPGDREEVAAEVLVGDDGIARALRVVGE